MQNDNLFKEMFVQIQKAHYILIVIEEDSDIDIIASSLALSNFFYESKIKHKVFTSSKELPRKLNFLSKFDKITKVLPKYYDLIIYLNCAKQVCLNEKFQEGMKIISINHFQCNSSFTDINIMDETIGSISELLYGFFNTNKLVLSKNTAECLYVGIYDNTSAFTKPKTNKYTFNVIYDLLTSNINPSLLSDKLLKRESLSKFRLIPKIMNTLELFNEGKLGSIYLDELWIKETGANSYECDEVIDMVLSLGIIELAVYFKMSDNNVECCLYSKGNIDISLLTNKFNGKGDKNTTRFSLPMCDFKDTREEVVNIILDYI